MTQAELDYKNAQINLECKKEMEGLVRQRDDLYGTLMHYDSEISNKRLEITKLIVEREELRLSASHTDYDLHRQSREKYIEIRRLHMELDKLRIERNEVIIQRLELKNEIDTIHEKYDAVKDKIYEEFRASLGGGKIRRRRAHRGRFSG